MKVVVAPDKFAGTLSAVEAARAIEAGWRRRAPGDDLTLDVDVTEARVSRSRPETGIVTFKCTIRNAAGQILCEMVSPIIVKRRADAEAII